MRAIVLASLAVSFSSSACKLFEFKPLENPMQHELVEKPFEHRDGWVYPPEGIGLGVDIVLEAKAKEKALLKYRDIYSKTESLVY